MIFFILGCLSSPPIKSPSQKGKTVLTMPHKTPKIEKGEDRPTEHQPIESVQFSVFFINSNQQLVPVQRRVPNGKKEQFALQSLYSGPNKEEEQQGLTLLKCQTTSANLLSITNGLAQVQLVGDCGDCGSIGIYDSIVKTLKQFKTVEYVHVLDPQGKTQVISNTTDARPECLEP